MKQRLKLFRRAWGVYYWVDSETGRQGSLRTRDRTEAERNEFGRSFDRYGRARIQPVDPAKGLGTQYYLSKYLSRTPDTGPKPEFGKKLHSQQTGTYI